MDSRTNYMREMFQSNKKNVKGAFNPMSMPHNRMQSLASMPVDTDVRLHTYIYVLISFDVDSLYFHINIFSTGDISV